MPSFPRHTKIRITYNPLGLFIYLLTGRLTLQHYEEIYGDDGSWHHFTLQTISLKNVDQMNSEMCKLAKIWFQKHKYSTMSGC